MHSQASVTLPLNTKRKVGFTLQVFSATPRIYCSLFATASLFVPRGACGGGFFGAAGRHVTLLNKRAGLSDTLGYRRPAEDRDLV